MSFRMIKSLIVTMVLFSGVAHADVCKLLPGDKATFPTNFILSQKTDGCVSWCHKDVPKFGGALLRVQEEVLYRGDWEPTAHKSLVTVSLAAPVRFEMDRKFVVESNVSLNRRVCALLLVSVDNPEVKMSIIGDALKSTFENRYGVRFDIKDHFQGTRS